MKKLLPLLLSATALLATHNATAQDAPEFRVDQGLLIIPNIRLGDDIYYVHLRRTNPAGYVFALEPASISIITPQPTDTWATQEELIGVWSPDDQLNLRITFDADGSFLLEHPAEEGCPAGNETGTWSYNEDTGVLLPRIETDGNSDCGFSHPDGVNRIRKTGTGLELVLQEPPEGEVVIPLIRR